MFEPGQLVICVDDVEHDDPPPPNGYWTGDLDGLRRGAIYTIRDYTPDHWIYGASVRLQEIQRPRRERGIEARYSASRFRPLPDERLEVFRQMLKPTELEEVRT